MKRKKITIATITVFSLLVGCGVWRAYQVEKIRRTPEYWDCIGLCMARVHCDKAFDYADLYCRHYVEAKLLKKAEDEARRAAAEKVWLKKAEHENAKKLYSPQEEDIIIRQPVAPSAELTGRNP